MTLTIAAASAAAAFAILGVVADRLASVWPETGAQRGGIGLRTAALAVGSGIAAAVVVARSDLPWWATGAYLVLLAILIVLAATDLEQRRLPHILLDPLIVLAAVFIPFNPAVSAAEALIGGGSAVAVLALLALVIRDGMAKGDLYLVLPIGFMLGFPAVFTALFAAALLTAAVSVGLLVARRVGMRSYVPFGPFLVAGTVLALILDGRVLAAVR